MSVHPMSEAPDEGVLSEEELGRKFHYYRLAGDSMEQIAERLGLSAWDVTRCYRRYLKNLARSTAEATRDEGQALELARLDALQQAVWAPAMRGDDKAIGKVLDIMKHRSRLLGLEELPTHDQATVHSVLVVGQSTAAFLESLEQGRKPVLTGSGGPDNEVVEGTVEEELEDA